MITRPSNLSAYAVVNIDAPFWQRHPKEIAQAIGSSVSGVYAAQSGRPIGARFIASTIMATGFTFEALFSVQRGTVRKPSPPPNTGPRQIYALPGWPGSWNEGLKEGLEPEPNPHPSDNEDTPVLNVNNVYYIDESNTLWIANKDSRQQPQLESVLRSHFGVGIEDFTDSTYLVTAAIAERMKERREK